MTGIVDFITQPNLDPAQAVDGELISTLNGVVKQVPEVPSRVDELVEFLEQGMLGTKLFLDTQGYEIRLVQTTERGSPVPEGQSPTRDNVHLTAKRLSEKATISADDWRDIRQVGATGFENLQSWLAQRTWSPINSVRATREYHKLGALKGLVLDADGSTITDLYDLFGFVAPTPIEFELDTATTDVRNKFKQARRVGKRALGNMANSVRWRAFAGDNFWDKLISHKSVKETFLNTAAAADLRGSGDDAITLGGVTIENYDGFIGNDKFVDPDGIHIFPVGAPGLYQQHFAPADRFPFNDGLGLKEYLMPYRAADGTSMDLIVQSNPVTLCTRPNALLPGVSNTNPAP